MAQHDCPLGFGIGRWLVVTQGTIVLNRTLENM